MGVKWFSFGRGRESKSSSPAPSPHPSIPHPSSAAALPTQHPGTLRQLFDDFDADGDGRISTADLESVLRRVHGSAGHPGDAAASMLWAADLDGDGYISLEEFALVLCGDDGVRREEELRSAFDVYDRDGDGVISAEELHRVLMGVMGEGAATLAECRSMIRAVDRDGDDAVNFDEFERMMSRRSSLA